ncbi:PAS domain-containing protein [Rubellimicrobium roseum]|uniref:PAS domain-containing protein n=1 Tax=Rubellimicrobium roseum TaxID=687525 RepID=A0A5C4NDN5_9RHOB|nr:PAS domain-containing protein [Rubellimicrobium roseum]TNC67231.1 PAS domain-containing protein [Rubellimicrobium roseum]
MPDRNEEAYERGAELDREHLPGDPFAAAIRRTRMPIIITDPRQEDNPVVFANDAFLELTGYGRDEVIGRNCRFLQGPDTDPACVAEIRRAIAEEWEQFRGDILNYRKDGTAFWNALFMSPVRDETGEILYFFASQHDVTASKAREQTMHERAEELEDAVDRRTRELQASIEEARAEARAKTVLLHEVDHRVKNNLQMIGSLIQMQAKRTSDPAAAVALRSVLSRVEALATVHRRLYQGDDVSRFDVATFACDLASDLVSAAGRADIRLELELEPVEISKDKAAPLALVVSELVTNAVQHAFRDRGGRLLVRVRPEEGELVIGIEDDGVGLPGQELGRGSFGRTVVEMLSRQLQAQVRWETADPGTRITVRMPRTYVEVDQ